MSKHTISVEPRDDDYSLVLCPHCGFDYLHLDEVYVAGRPREDDPIVAVKVDAGGAMLRGQEVMVPHGAHGLGRRHTIAIAGWCEGCGQRVAFSFQQHKGQTHLSTLTQTWTTIG